MEVKTTVFCRKPGDLSNLIQETKRILRKNGEQPTDKYYVAEDVQLSLADYCRLTENLNDDTEWAARFSKNWPGEKDGAVPAIRVTCKDYTRNLIIDTQGYSYPRYVGLEFQP